MDRTAGDIPANRNPAHSNPATRARPARTRATRTLAVLLAVATTFGIVGVASPALAASGTGALTVILMNPAKAKIELPGVRVQLLAPDGHQVQSITTGTRGRATFSGVPIGVTYHVHAEPTRTNTTEDVLAADRADISVVGGGHVWTVVVMRKGGSLGGTAAYEWGSPMPYAEVAVRGLSTGYYREIPADANGHFWQTGLPTDDYTIEYNQHPADAGAGNYYSYNWAWSFWHTGANPALTSSVHVQQEDGAHVATVRDGLDGVVPEGATLTGYVPGPATVPSPTVSIVSEQVGGTYDSVVQYSDGTQSWFSEHLAPGRYRFGVHTGATVAWYAGEGVAPAPSITGATWVTVGTSGTPTITFGAIR